MEIVECRSIYIANRSTRIAVDEAELELFFHGLERGAELPAPPEGELSIVIMDDAEHCQLHADFLNDPEATDVITFPGDPEMGFAGEVAINVDEAARRVSSGAEQGENASEPGTMQTLQQELTLYLIHGWLHLAGYDDKEPEKRIAMREAERQLLAHICENNLWPEFEER